MTDPDSAWWWERLREGEVRIPQCRCCQAVWFPPTGRCPRCASDDIGSRAAPATAELYSYVTTHRDFGTGTALPYTVVVADFGDAVKMFGALLDQAGAVDRRPDPLNGGASIGTALEPVPYSTEDGSIGLGFRPVTSRAHPKGSTTQPLDGIRILGFTHIGAGPYALSMLGDFGADVVNIEPLAGDHLRTRDKAYPGLSAYFLGINRNKRSLALDLKREQAREIVARLVARTDVVVHNFRPGAAERLGFGFDALTALKPDLVYCEISAWGRQGPMATDEGMDLLAQARGGMMSLNGIPGMPPSRIPPPIADFTGSYLACMGILLALRARDLTGSAQAVDISLLAGQIATMANFIPLHYKTGRPAEPLGFAHPQLVPYQPFLTADGYLIVACLTEATWRGLCRAIERPDLAEDPQFVTNAGRVEHREALLSTVEPIFKRRTMAEWQRVLDREGVPAGPIHDLAQVFADPQVVANDLIVRSAHPVAGEVAVAANPIRIRQHTPPARPAALVGEHSAEVLAELGYGSEEIAELVRSAVITTSEVSS